MIDKAVRQANEQRFQDLVVKVGHDSKSIKKDKKSKKQMREKMIKKQFDFQIIKSITSKHKYLIRGDIIIDINLIREKNIFTHCNIDFKEFRPPRTIQYLKQHKFFEIEFGRSQKPLKDFGFISDILDSMGDQKIHYLAEQIKEYKNCCDSLDKLLKNFRMDKEIIVEDDESFCSLQRPEKEGEWTYEMSLQKAARVLQMQFAGNKFNFYTILKGNFDQYEIAIQGLQEDTISLFFGKIQNAEMVKILLQNGNIMKNRNIIDMISQNIKSNYSIITSKNIDYDEDYSKFSLEITNQSINNYSFKMIIQFDKFKLSNYKDRFNDYLIIGRINEKDMNQLNSQVFIQKALNSQEEVDKEMLMDIGYSAQTEYFLDKYYTKNSNELDNQNQHDSQDSSLLLSSSPPTKRCGYKKLNTHSQ